MRLIRCCTLVLFLLVCALLGASFVAYRSFSTRQAPAAAKAPAAAPASTAPTAVNAAGSPIPLPPGQSFDQKVSAVERVVASAPPGAHTPISVAVTEAELNAKLGQQPIKGASFELASPTIELTPGNVTVRGVYTGSGFQGVPMGVTMSLRAQDGKLVPTVERVDVNGLNVPLGVAPQVRDQLTSQLQRALDRESAGLPVIVTNVQVGSHVMTVEGTTK